MTLSELESHLWESANILRGPVDAADFKTYIFPLLFFKGLGCSQRRKRSRARRVCRRRRSRFLFRELSVPDSRGLPLAGCSTGRHQCRPGSPDSHAWDRTGKSTHAVWHFRRRAVDEQGPLGVEWCDKDFWVIDTAYYASTLTPDVDLKYLYHLVKFIGLNHLKDGTSNPTLQAMALFQSWFLDFDPVRQKMDRNQPSTRASGHPSPNGRRAGGEGRFALDPATAALFPEHLEDSAPGPIPKGWKAGTVVEGFNLTMEQSPPGETYNEEGNVPPFYQGRTDFSFRFPTRRIYCSAPTRYAKPGDTLVSVRTIVGTSTLRMRNAASGVVSQPCATNPARPHSPITLWRTSIPTSPASRPREPSSGPSIKIASRNFPS